MAEYKCPKCGGSDYFMSQRNVVKGMGWAQRGSIKSIPVCRVCDEIMQGAQIGLKNWEDYGSGRSQSQGFITKRTLKTIVFLGVLWISFQIGLELWKLDDPLGGAPPSLPILFLLISLFLLVFLPRITKNIKYAHRGKTLIINVVAWITILGIFFLYAYFV